ncbi:MAG: 1-deoxy-D-xylulose-5-phosphate synthase, partial [Erysipelotrichaceae bacterium]|nr:1-deoxy-D-xylulose-5-phosphate synthase [Erysipelotrichaceae bacterium]
SIKEERKDFVITNEPEEDHILHKCKEEDLAISVINARFFKPLDTAMLEKIMRLQLPIIVFETDIRNGGLSSAILEYCNDHGFSSSCIERIGIQDHFVGHGDLASLRKQEKIDLQTLMEKLRNWV